MMYQSDAFHAVQGGINTFGGLFFGPVFNTTTGIPLGFPGAGTPINLITGELGFGVGGETYLEATTDEQSFEKPRRYGVTLRYTY